MNIWNCRSLATFEQFLIKLEKDSEEEFKQDALSSDLSPSMLVQKIFDLHRSKLSEASSPAEVSNVYIETNSTLTHLKNVLNDPRMTIIAGRALKLKESTQLTNLGTTCIAKTRENPEAMERMINRYNDLIGRAELFSKNQLPDQQFAELKYLNQFIGVPWTTAQEEGKQLPPKWSLEGFVQLPPKKLSDCETISQLNQYLEQLDAPLSEERKNALSKKLVTLYEKEKQMAPYSKIPLAYQTSRANSILNQLDVSPPQEVEPLKKKAHQNQVAIKKIETECISTLRRDQTGKKLIQEKWNALAEEINRSITEQILDSSRKDELTANQLAELNHLAVCSDFSLSTDQLKGKGILPIYLDVNHPIERKKAVETYQSYALWINEERHLLQMLEEREQLKAELSPDRLALGSLPEQTVQKKKIHLEYLEDELINWPEPLSEGVFDSLFVIARQLGEELEILNADHRSGEKPLPLFGKDISIGKERPNHILYKNPEEWKSFCISLDLFNDNLLGFEREKVKRELMNESKTKHLSWEEFEKKQSWLTENEKKNLLDLPPQRRRKMQKQLANLLLKNAIFFYHLPTEKQLKGLEKWPLADWRKEPPTPSLTELQQDILSLDLLQIPKLVDHFPNSWKDAIVKGLKSLIVVRQSEE